MRNHDAPVGNFGCDVGEPARDVFVGQAVESIAANALGVERLRNRKAVRHLGMPAMEGRVEAGHLQNLRLPLQDRPDWRQIVWLMQRSERHETREAVEHKFADDGRRAVVRTAVNDTVADDDRQPTADLRSKERDDLVERCRHATHFRRRPRLVDEQFPFGIFGEQARVRADTLDLSLEAPLEPVARADLEQLELDARAARIHHEDSFPGHRSGPHRLFCPAIVSEEHGDRTRRHPRPEIICPGGCE